MAPDSPIRDRLDFVLGRLQLGNAHEGYGELERRRSMFCQPRTLSRFRTVQHHLTRGAPGTFGPAKAISYQRIIARKTAAVAEPGRSVIYFTTRGIFEM